MISEDRLSKALQYLATTDEPAAKAKALMLGLEGQEKTILAIEYLKHSGTVAEREAMARTSNEFREWSEKHNDAVYEFELMKNKRNTESMIVEVWRSLNAARRQGIVT